MAPDTVAQIAPDVWRITLPLPFRLRAVHLYLVRGDDGYTLIDAGLDTKSARDVYDDALRALGVLPTSIVRLYVTHMHPDHIGMSGRHAAAGALAYIIRDEERRARYVWGSTPLDDWVAFLKRHGMAFEAADGATRVAADLRACVTLPERFEYLADGDVAPVGNRSCRVVWTPGHSDHHYVLVDDSAEMIFAGDHLLPSISPNIGLYPECRPDPLGDYLWSLGRFTRESAYTVLPAHGEIYADLPTRIGELRTHHDERLAGVRACAVEIAAHLEHLRLKGDLAVAAADGVDRYRSG